MGLDAKGGAFWIGDKHDLDIIQMTCQDSRRYITASPDYYGCPGRHSSIPYLSVQLSTSAGIKRILQSVADKQLGCVRVFYGP